MYNVTFRRTRDATVTVEKQENIAHTECVFVPLVIQHTKRMRRSILSFVACPALL